MIIAWRHGTLIIDLAVSSLCYNGKMFLAKLLVEDCEV